MRNTLGPPSRPDHPISKRSVEIALSHFLGTRFPGVLIDAPTRASLMTLDREQRDNTPVVAFQCAYSVPAGTGGWSCRVNKAQVVALTEHQQIANFVDVTAVVVAAPAETTDRSDDDLVVRLKNPGVDLFLIDAADMLEQISVRGRGTVSSMELLAWENVASSQGPWNIARRLERFVVPQSVARSPDAPARFSDQSRWLSRWNIAEIWNSPSPLIAYFAR